MIKQRKYAYVNFVLSHSHKAPVTHIRPTAHASRASGPAFVDHAGKAGLVRQGVETSRERETFIRDEGDEYEREERE